MKVEQRYIMEFKLILKKDLGIIKIQILRVMVIVLMIIEYFIFFLNKLFYMTYLLKQKKLFII